jgi:hypothetical protein
MSNVTYYHGTNNADHIVNCIEGNGKLRTNFHLTTDIDTARNYGGKVVKIVLESDLTTAHVGLINKDGNYNESVGNKTETVLKTPASINEFYFKVWDVEVVH